jgi:hypothetical protein
LRDDSEEVQQAVAQALKKLWTRDDIPSLILLLAEGYSAVREVLASLPPEDVSPVLRPLLIHPDGPVRGAVIPLYEEARWKAGLPREPGAFSLPDFRSLPHHTC